MESRLLFASLLFFFFVGTCYGAVHLSTLKQTLEVTASPNHGQVLKAGDNLTVTWGLDQSLPSGTDGACSRVKIQLCYAPISQQDRAWRKTADDLKKDKTCQFTFVTKPYDPSKKGKQTQFVGPIERDVPTATYFVRAYAYDSSEQQVAFGQTTNLQKTTNLFDIQAITGRHLSLDIASICFSAFAVVSLFGFFYLEKRMAGKSS